MIAHYQRRSLRSRTVDGVMEEFFKKAGFILASNRRVSIENDVLWFQINRQREKVSNGSIYIPPVTLI